MDEPGPLTTDDQDGSRAVFISYATADRKQALNLCKGIERRGTQCWIAARDVAPGENYQEAIVRSLRESRAMILVFSNAANHSDEIKKELSLASRYKVPVIALRIEGVEPSDAFAYELSTRQWIDGFEGLDKSIDQLVGRIDQLSRVGRDAAPPARQAVPGRSRFASRGLRMIGSIVLLLLVAAGAWWQLRPAPAAAHSMAVRLAGFQLLSTGLPPTLREAISAEITSAFNADGVVGVSTTSIAGSGAAPAYTLDGTVQRDGERIRVITRMTNERSGATVWSDNFNYEAKAISNVPRRIAVDAGNVIRCGLFGASTYSKPLPDSVLRDYLQFCSGYWDPNLNDGRKALIPAQRVVAAAPDFSWGWAAVAGAYWKVAFSAADERLAEEARAAGRRAADRAVAIDGNNSEALWIKSLLIDRIDWIGRESLLKRSVAARSLDCGCEHHQYGEMLMSVGRIANAVDQLRQASDMLALYVYTHLSLAEALVTAGKLDEAKPVFDSAIDLAPESDFASRIAMNKASSTGDIEALLDPKLPLSAEKRAALMKGYRAGASRNAAVKAEAVRTLLELPENQQNHVVAKLLADLGADREAFELARRIVIEREGNPSIFWHRSMRRTLSNPAFAATAEQLGLMNYWKKSRSMPDACSGDTPPSFCRMI